MARQARGSGGNITAGVSANGGSGQGDAPGGSGPGDGSGDGGGDGDGSIIRPSLSGNGDGNDNGDGGTGGDRPKRGRPAGSRTREKKAEISVTTLAEVIEFAHVGLAAVLSDDAWTLDSGECDKLASAAQKVLRHHDTPAFSAYAMDWLGLLMVAGKIYGPRVAHAAAKPPRSTPQPSTRTEPHNPVAQQEEGGIVISHPDGSGRLVRMPVAN